MTDEILEVSKQKVMKSAAGYYIGTTCVVKDENGTYTTPYSRDSHYFASKYAAQTFFNYTNECDPE